MIGEIRQNFTEASASVGLILATALTLLDSFCTSMKTILDRALFTHKNCDFGMISAREQMPALCRAYL